MATSPSIITLTDVVAKKMEELEAQEVLFILEVVELSNSLSKTVLPPLNIMNLMTKEVSYLLGILRQS